MYFKEVISAMRVSFKKEVQGGLEPTVEKLTQELQKVGFGVLDRW